MSMFPNGLRLTELLAAIVLSPLIGLLNPDTPNACSTQIPPTEEVLQYVAIQTEVLKLGDSLTRQLSGGQHHSYQIALAANDFLQIVVEQKGIDVVLAIRDTTLSKLAEADRPNGSRGRETISFIATEAGTYSLVIRSLEGVAAQGTYNLRLALLRPTTTQDGDQITAEQAVSEAETLRSIGSAESIAKAIKKFDEAAALWRRLEQPYEEAVAFYGSGISCSFRGENQRALDYLARALPLFNKDTDGEAITRAAIGWSYMYLGELDEALDSFTRAFKLFASQENVRGEGIALYGSGWVLALQANDQRALEHFRQSLSRRRRAQDRRGEAVTLTGLGKVEARLRHYQDAINHLKEALDILPTPRDRYVEADILSNLGWIYNTRREDRLAIEHFNQALELRRKAGDQIGTATTLYGISTLQRRLNQFSDAASAVEEALNIIESLRARGSNQQLSISYFASIQEYYEFYISLLMQLDLLHPERGYAAKALHANERARARALIDLLATTRAEVPDEINSTGRHVSNSPSADASPLSQSTPLTASEIQQEVLDGGTVLLEYALGQDRSYVWVVTSKEMASYELPSQAVIEGLASQYYASLTVRNRVERSESGAKRALINDADKIADQLARELSTLLLSPVAGYLPGKRLAIVAPGMLQLIPFAALPSPGTGPRQKSDHSQRIHANRHVALPDNRRPLIIDHEVVVLPSATTLAVLRRHTKTRKPRPKTVAVVADPVFSPGDERILDGSTNTGKSTFPKALKEKKTGFSNASLSFQPETEFPRLISSRWEARQILSLVPPEEGKLLLDFAANRTTVSSKELGHYRFVHFATHAVIDNHRPEMSSIVLSMVDENGIHRDGLLRSPDIYNLKLPVELIVLSACRTGLGRDFKGEGLVGLTRGFMYAGAPRVVVSLWDVDDKPTSELMVRFYRQMLGPNKLSPAAALRAAQLEFWNDSRWQSPYFWAAFVLQGEWR